MNFYLHYLGDYDRDTKGLSLIEHGAYRVLLDHVYATEDRLPDDKGECYRIAKAMTPAERRAVDTVLGRFFPVNGDGRRHNKRAEEEIARAREKSQKASQSAERRWGRKPDADADLMRTHSAGNANQNQKPEGSTTSAANAAEARDAVATLQDCPLEKLIELYHELVPLGTRMEKRTPARLTLMRARWRDESKPNRDKHRGYASIEDGLAYWRRFFAYVAESKFLTGQVEGRDGKPPFVASLPWLMKAENFAKVIEGTYHRDI